MHRTLQVIIEFPNCKQPLRPKVPCTHRVTGVRKTRGRGRGRGLSLFKDPNPNPNPNPTPRFTDTHPKVSTTVDCKTVGFFLKISKEIGKACRKSLTCEVSFARSRSLFSASFQTFCLTARVYLNSQKYGQNCSRRPRRKQ